MSHGIELCTPVCRGRCLQHAEPHVLEELVRLHEGRVEFPCHALWRAGRALFQTGDRVPAEEACRHHGMHRCSSISTSIFQLHCWRMCAYAAGDFEPGPAATSTDIVQLARPRATNSSNVAAAIVVWLTRSRG